MNALDSLLDFAFQLDSASETLGSGTNNNDSDNDNDNGNGNGNGNSNGQHIPGARCNEETWRSDTAITQLGMHNLTHLNNNDRPTNTVYQSTIPLSVSQQQPVPAYTMYAADPCNEPKHAYDMPPHTPNYYTEVIRPVDEHIPQHLSAPNYGTSYNPTLLQPCHCVSNVPPWDRCDGNEAVKKPVAARPFDFFEPRLYTPEDSQHHDILGMFHGQATGNEQLQLSDGVYGFDKYTSTREQITADASRRL